MSYTSADVFTSWWDVKMVTDFSLKKTNEIHQACRPACPGGPSQKSVLIQLLGEFYGQFFQFLRFRDSAGGRGQVWPKVVS